MPIYPIVAFCCLIFSSSTFAQHNQADVANAHWKAVGETTPTYEEHQSCIQRTQA